MNPNVSLATSRKFLHLLHASQKSITMLEFIADQIKTVVSTLKAYSDSGARAPDTFSNRKQDSLRMQPREALLGGG